MPPVEVITRAVPVNSAQSVTRGVKISILELELRKAVTWKPKSPVYRPVQVEAHEENLDLVKLHCRLQNYSSTKKKYTFKNGNLGDEGE